MAITVTINNRQSVGNQWEVQADLLFASHYLTNGMSLTPAMLGLTVIKDLKVNPKSGHEFEYDYDNQKLKAFRGAGFTPAGTVAAPTFTGTPATPAGTVAAPTFTGESYTPAGTNDTSTPPLFTGTAHTLAGTNNAPAFTGTQATPAGTNSAPAFSGTAVAQAALAEVTNDTDLSTTPGTLKATVRGL